MPKVSDDEFRELAQGDNRFAGLVRHLNKSMDILLRTAQALGESFGRIARIQPPSRKSPGLLGPTPTALAATADQLDNQTAEPTPRRTRRPNGPITAATIAGLSRRITPSFAAGARSMTALPPGPNARLEGLLRQARTPGAPAELTPRVRRMVDQLGPAAASTDLITTLERILEPTAPRADPAKITAALDQIQQLAKVTVNAQDANTGTQEAGSPEDHRDARQAPDGVLDAEMLGDLLSEAFDSRGSAVPFGPIPDAPLAGLSGLPQLLGNVEAPGPVRDDTTAEMARMLRDVLAGQQTIIDSIREQPRPLATWGP